MFSLSIRIECLAGQLGRTHADRSQVADEAAALERSLGKAGYGSIWRRRRRERRASATVPKRDSEDSMVSALNTTGYWTADRTPSDGRRKRHKQWSILE